ncbi:GNAT family N-acetyltransferase [Pontibacter cellulosilyticus]|uniref:GNAT family N-acetyltransferase n=1 Tax=Pontibacter cellulosilyticus TaxID=1720253 RepID=A0A923SHU5_9BACT|nr:GNAT family N-acetyltransferase [Pontibacter cellulosilyticus]MBC5992063.1 GNAT family N-acetyltransferase [Pontibacter cellulosilyticus]
MTLFTLAETTDDLQQILVLQSLNCEDSLTPDEVADQGFLTARHTLSLLEEMGQKYKHVVAKKDGQVIGYALVMLKEFSDKLPVLTPLINVVEELSYEAVPLNTATYFIMGQICVAKEHRGQKVFEGLYRHLQQQMQPHFDYVVTGVAQRNTRSVRAHYNVGFKSILKFGYDIGEKWNIILWDWK